MIGRFDKSPQLDIFKIPLKHRIPGDNELARLAGKIRWDRIAVQLSIHYSPDRGRKAIPVRKIAGILILKQIFGGSDSGILKGWLENPDFQYFCGEVYYQDKALFNRSDLVNFRKRIGAEGLNIVFYPELLNLIGSMRATREKQMRKEKNPWHILNFFRQLFHSAPAPEAV